MHIIPQMVIYHDRIRKSSPQKTQNSKKMSAKILCIATITRQFISFAASWSGYERTKPQ